MDLVASDAPGAYLGMTDSAVFNNLYTLKVRLENTLVAIFSVRHAVTCLHAFAADFTFIRHYHVLLLSIKNKDASTKSPGKASEM